MSKVKLHSKLQKLKDSIEKRTSITDVFVDPTHSVPCINTGSTVLNMLIGGSRLEDGKFVCPGWPKGRIVELYGRESSGKTTIAIAGMAQAIAAGGCGLYADLECAVVDAYSKKLGVDFEGNQAIRAQPHTAEETETLVMTAALNGVDIIVVDSVAGLVSSRETMRDVSNEKEKQAIAEIPRFMSTWMPKLQRVISKTGTVVIFLNQTRDKIGAMGYTEEALKTTTGGNALRFWSSIRVLLKPKTSVKAKQWNPILKQSEDVQIATDIECKIIKNKIDAKQGHSGLITIRYGAGIDELRTMFNVAEAYNLIKKSKNAKKQDVYRYESKSSSIEEIGMEKFRLALKHADNGSILSELIEQCRDKIVQGYRMIDEEQLAALASDAVTKKMFDDEDDEDDGNGPEIIEEESEAPGEAIKIANVEV